MQLMPRSGPQSGEEARAGISEKQVFKDFLRKLIEIDDFQGRLLYGAIFETFQGTVVELMENQYLYRHFGLLFKVNKSFMTGNLG